MHKLQLLAELLVTTNVLNNTSKKCVTQTTVTFWGSDDSVEGTRLGPEAQAKYRRIQLLSMQLCNLTLYNHMASFDNIINRTVTQCR